MPFISPLAAFTLADQTELTITIAEDLVRVDTVHPSDEYGLGHVIEMTPSQAVSVAQSLLKVALQQMGSAQESRPAFNAID